jgi:hypothetical protein
VATQHRTLTRNEVDEVTKSLGQFRFRLWMACQPHHIENLPRTSDTREVFCPTCYSVFDAGGIIVNPPERTDRA